MNRLARLRLWQIDALGAGVCALLALAWYGAGVEPLSRAKAERLTRLDELSQRETKARALQNARRAMQLEFQGVEREMRGTISLQPVERTTERQGNIRALAEELRLRVDEVKPGTPTPGMRCTKVPIVLSGSGKGSDCARFLHAVRERYPDVGVAGFGLRGEPENPDKPAHFVFNFVWYAAAEPGTPAK